MISNVYERNNEIDQYNNKKLRKVNKNVDDIFKSSPKIIPAIGKQGKNDILEVI